MEKVVAAIEVLNFPKVCQLNKIVDLSGGLGGVVMRGDRTDWVKLIHKLDRLKLVMGQENMEAWFENTKDIFSKLLDSYDNRPDLEWWGRIMSWFPDFATTDSGLLPCGLLHVEVNLRNKINIPEVQENGLLIAGIMGSSQR